MRLEHGRNLMDAPKQINRTIIWLASYPKSGNTWLRIFLHNLFSRADSPRDINRLHLLSQTEDRAGLYARYDPRPASAYTMEDVQRMRPLVHRDLAAMHDKMVFVKTHNALLLAAGTPLLTPEFTAGAIYIVRDPRDVAVSYSRYFNTTINEAVRIIGDKSAMSGGDDAVVPGQTSSWSVHVQTWTHRLDRRLHIVRYEDMCRHPLSTFGGICRFLGIDVSEHQLAQAIEFSSFAVSQKQEKSAGFVERSASAQAFFRSGKAEQWRMVLTSLQASRIAGEHGGQMKRFGYL